MTKYYIEEIRETTFKGTVTSEFHIFERFWWLFKHYQKSANYRGNFKEPYNSIEDARKQVERLTKVDNENRLNKIVKTEKITHGVN